MIKRYVIGLFGLSFGALFLYIAIRDVDIEKTIDVLSNANLILFLPYFLCIIIFYYLKSIRYKMILADIKEVKIADLFGPIMIGFAVNNILPFRMGEIVRMYVTSKKLKISQLTVLSSIGLERLFDMMGLIIFALSLPLLKKNSILNLGREFFILAIFCMLLFVFGFILIRFRYKSKDLLLYCFSFLPKRFFYAIETKVDRIINGLISLKNIRVIKSIIINTIVQWGLMISCIMLSAKSVSIHLSISAAVLVLLICTIGVALPSAPAFIGTIELSFVMVLGWYGIPVDKALAVAIIYHSLNFIIVTSTGILLAYRMGIRINHISSYVSSVNDN
jgi:uncharacterized protein (TIRG00374 family)